MLRIVAVVWMLTAGLIPAQKTKYEPNTTTSEGVLLTMVAHESDDAQKIALLEEYFQRYPKHEGASYAYNILVPLYVKAGQLDKAIDAAAKALALDPLATPLAFKALESCEAKKDVECIKTWSARTAESARKVVALPKPSSDSEVESWSRDVDFATQVIQRAEYSLYATGLQASDPKLTIDMYETLAGRNPQSVYLPQLAARYILSLQATGQRDKVLEIGAKEDEAGRANEDILLVLADAALNAKQYDQSAGYATKAAARLEAATSAPAGVDAAAWEAKRKSSLGLAYWIAGFAYASVGKYPESDKAMRAALPSIESNNELLPAAYFFLGVANFKMAEGPKGDKTRMPDARKYTSLCASMPSPYQATAKKNLAAMGPAPGSAKKK